jgi:glycosyltransferase involved in cell wall biosynthesis
VKRILVISPFVPYPPDRGHRVRIYYLLKQLCQRFEVALVTQYFTQREEEMAKVLSSEPGGVTSVTALKAPTHRSVFHRTYAAIGSRAAELLGRPRELFYHASPTLRRQVDRLSRQFKPDLVQVHYWFAAGGVPASCMVPVWIDSIDVHMRRERSIAERQGAWAVRRWQMFRSASVARHEFSAYRSADRVITVHDVEREIVGEQIGIDRVMTIPIALAVPPKPPERTPERVVAFLGAMDYPPNRDAVEFLLKAIMPRVRKAMPDCRLRIVGGGAQRWQRAFSQEWVDWPGHVPSLETALHDVSVAVAPMRAGAGTNVKVLSLLSLGLPTVATNHAVEGLELVSGEHLLIGDDAAGIANGIVALLSDRKLAERLGSAGHDAMRNHHHWENGCRWVCDHYEAASAF